MGRVYDHESGEFQDSTPDETPDEEDPEAEDINVPEPEDFDILNDTVQDIKEQVTSQEMGEEQVRDLLKAERKGEDRSTLTEFLREVIESHAAGEDPYNEPEQDESVECPACGEEFDSEEAMHQHRADAEH